VTQQSVPDDGFSGRKAAEIVGISYRQLDYWARTDLIRPSLTDASGSGSRRSYSYRDLLELKVIKRLLDGGVKLEQVRQAFRYIREQLGEDVASANIILSGSGTVVVESDDELVDAVKNGQGVLNVILAVGPIKDELDASVHSLHRDEVAVAVVAAPGAAEVV
jgi:DNA-binding transcriptional MerR regulator